MNAIFSDCQTHRYRLDRDLGRAGPVICLIGVNPSVADGVQNDMTIRKDIGFGRRNGWGRLIKVNKFSLISTDINGLREAPVPSGPENDRHIREALAEADQIIGCWGTLSKLPPSLRERWREVAAMAEELDKVIHCFGTVADGQPRHTGRISYETPIVRWSVPLGAFR